MKTVIVNGQADTTEGMIDLCMIINVPSSWGQDEIWQYASNAHIDEWSVHPDTKHTGLWASDEIHTCDNFNPNARTPEVCAIIASEEEK